MQFWNWFFLATAVLTTAKPSKLYTIDISTLPECMQECMRQNNEHFDIEQVPRKRVCKETSYKIVKFWDFLAKDLTPCLRNQCEETKEENSEALDAWYHDLCGHRLSQHDDDD